jgi:hypothetical protein
MVDKEDADREEAIDCEDERLDREPPGEEGAEKEEEERKEDVDLREGLTSSPDFLRMALGGIGGCPWESVLSCDWEDAKGNATVFA